MRWLWIAECGGPSLCRQMLATGADPSVAYRLVSTRTGLNWTELRKRGALWFIETMFRPGTRFRKPTSKGADRRLVEPKRRA